MTILGLLVAPSSQQPPLVVAANPLRPSHDAARDSVLSQAEVARLINSAPTPFYRILLMTLYATGARCAEAARLQVCDIDSQRMVVHIRGGKGREDREVMLSVALLQALREHWSRLKPKVWLFPGGRWHTAAQPIRTKTLWHACHLAAQRAGLKKSVHPHTLRHYVPSRTMSGNGDRQRI